ncbi:MAG: vWA domain-containing protein [Acidimicrobiales bacterium]
MPAGFRYSRWDGTQSGFDVDADGVLSQLTDDLIYHGDLDAALRRLLAEGVTGPDGERAAGLRELIERLRRRRQEELANNDLGGAFSEIARELREIVQRELEAIDGIERDAVRSGDEHRRHTAQASAAERRMRLDLLPSNLAGQVQELSSYDFASAEAGRRYDDLVERLRQELLQSRFNEMTGAMANLGPEQLQRTKDMLAAVNHMIDERARGVEPDFAAFMASYGDFFPENPRSLDELLEGLAAQMAAFQSFVSSLSAGQRAELARLSDQLLGDMDLRWQLDQLSRNLQGAFPDLGWANSYESSGQGPLSMLDAVAMVDRLGQIDALEGLLSGATSPGALAEVDPDVARELLGDDGARSLDRLAELARTMAEAGLIEQREGRLELTPRGLRRLGQNALTDLFARLTADRLGHHANDREGPGHERSYDTKAYEFGDPFNLNIERTIRNSLRRAGGLPVTLHPDDFEVERTETLTRASTVLAIDLSLSMPMRDNFLAAKKTAIALHSLISGRYPSDYLGIVGFSEVARALRPDQLPEVSWDFVFGTNMQHALLLARRMLAGRPGSRQVMMITDGEPTAHITAEGEPLFHYPPTRETVEATLGEVVRCTREGIRINTFMLDATPHLQTFVERLSRINRGRVFFTTPETLGDYVLVDFIDQKRARRTGRSA